jgi:hypothetical protein
LARYFAMRIAARGNAMTLILPLLLLLVYVGALAVLAPFFWVWVTTNNRSV